MKTQAEIVIYRNRSTVFEHLTDPDKLAKWSQGLITSTPSTELAEHAPYIRVVRTGRAKKIFHGEVTGFAPGETFEFQLDLRAMLVQVRFELHSLEGEAATRLVATQEIAPRTLLARLRTLARARSIQIRQETDLARLNLYLDRGGDKRA